MRGAAQDNLIQSSCHSFNLPERYLQCRSMHKPDESLEKPGSLLPSPLKSKSSASRRQLTHGAAPQVYVAKRFRHPRAEAAATESIQVRPLLLLSTVVLWSCMSSEMCPKGREVCRWLMSAIILPRYTSALLAVKAHTCSEVATELSHSAHVAWM